jgi:hypothetical protein
MSAIRGRFASYRSVPSRDCIQVVIEFNSDQQEQVFAALGYPRPGTDTWVGLARLQDPAPAPVRAAFPHGEESPTPTPRASLPSHGARAVREAGMLAKDRAFWEWLLRERPADALYTENDAANFIREWCDVKSRAEFSDNAAARERFLELKACFERDVGRVPEMRG